MNNQFYQDSHLSNHGAFQYKLTYNSWILTFCDRIRLPFFLGLGCLGLLEHYLAFEYNF
jgi:hypothetical protein